MNSPALSPPIAVDQPPLPQPGMLSRWWSNVTQVLLEFLPPPLRKIAEKGLVGTLSSLILIFVIIPPAIVLLAATSIGWLGESDKPLIKMFHNWYVRSIQDGFSIEEVTERSHANLDYFQSFEFDLSKDDPIHTKKISIKKNQHASIFLSHVSASSFDEKCSLIEKNVTLVDITLAKQPLDSYAKEDNVTKLIDADWWNGDGAKFKAESVPPDLAPLVFKLANDAKAKLPNCTVHVEGSIRVYKKFVANSTGAPK